MKIYIAGPYSHPDPITNTQTAIIMAERVIAKGHIPYIPHLTMLWHLVSPHPIEFWYEYDKFWLRYCNGVLRISGPSTGADDEVAVAKSLCIPIYYSVDELPSGGWDAPK